MIKGIWYYMIMIHTWEHTHQVDAYLAKLNG